MESDFISPSGVVYPEFLTGRTVRSVAQKGQRVSEYFAILLHDDLPADHYLDWHSEGAFVVDVRRFEAVPGWDPALAYARPIPDLPPSHIADFFAGNLEATTGPVVRDLRFVRPMDEPTFWSIVGTANDAEVKLSLRPLPEIEAFARRLFLMADSLNNATVAAQQAVDVLMEGDSFLAWRLAVIAKGQAYYSSVLGGDRVDQIQEDEWENGDQLIGVAERAAETALGSIPEFIQLTLEQVGGQGKYLHGDGKVDLRPGPRTAASMFGRGLLPALLGSRFIVSAPSGPVECVVIQHVDPDNEALESHLFEAAKAIAAELDGALATSVEHHNTYTQKLVQGGSVFEIRRRWTGTLGSTWIATS